MEKPIVYNLHLCPHGAAHSVYAIENQTDHVGIFYVSESGANSVYYSDDHLLRTEPDRLCTE